MPADDDEDEGTWCYCKESKRGGMVACDNQRCEVKWFSFGMPGNVKSTIQKMDVPHMSPSFEVKSKKNCEVEQ